MRVKIALRRCRTPHNPPVAHLHRRKPREVAVLLDNDLGQTYPVSGYDQPDAYISRPTVVAILVQSEQVRLPVILVSKRIDGSSQGRGRPQKRPRFCF